MSYLEKISFENPKLCIFYLGGRFEGCNIEMHDIVFLVGQSSEDIIPKIKNRWRGTPSSLHVDSWFAVENVDGFDVRATLDSEYQKEQHLYFVNLGAYKKGQFGESHFVTLEVSKSKQEAISKAKLKVPEELEMVHSDDIFDVEDCIKIDFVDNYRIELIYTGKPSTQNSVNGWQRLKD
ncbi:MAG: DUF1543 domain-containing protein [Bdellovibrio sp.]